MKSGVHAGYASRWTQRRSTFAATNRISLLRIEESIGASARFKELVVSEDGLVYSRYMYSMNITDPDKRDRFLKKKLNQKELRFMGYRTFINMLSCRDFDRNVKYILPACVVSQIRAKFPNENGEPYTGYVSLKSKDGQSLP